MSQEKTVIYRSQYGAEIRVTPSQEKMMVDAMVWPKDGQGNDIGQVYKGAVNGAPSWTDDQIAAFCESRDQRVLPSI